jgi:hypothetical protein
MNSSTATNTTAAEAIALYRTAVTANQNTGVRRGNVVELTESGAERLVLGADLHNHWENYLVITSAADLTNPRCHLVLQEVCHGGPKDKCGGCQSFKMLEAVAKLKVDHPENFHFLLSNHEWAELVEHPICKGGCVLNLSFRMGLQSAYRSAADEVHAAAREFIASCPLAVRTSNGLFCTHSIPEAADSEGFDASVFSKDLVEDDFRSCGDIARMVWGRDFRLANSQAFLKEVNAQFAVTGHEPCEEGFHEANAKHLIIDSSHEAGTYLDLPIAEALTMKRLLGYVQRCEA